MPPTKDSTSEALRDQGPGTPRHGHLAGHVDERGQEQQSHEGHEDAHSYQHGHIERFDLIRIVVTALIASLVWFRGWEPLPRISLLGVAGVLFGGCPIFREAFENIRERRMTMELSMTIALFAALFIGEFFTALVISVFVLVAEVLEGLRLVAAGAPSAIFSTFCHIPHGL
jgi:Cd2+/Zn2+-exporting ATPase/Cu+-exporting ATPase